MAKLTALMKLLHRTIKVPQSVKSKFLRLSQIPINQEPSSTKKH